MTAGLRKPQEAIALSRPNHPEVLAEAHQLFGVQLPKLLDELNEVSAA